MSYLSFAPDASAAAASNIAELGSNLATANAAAAGATTGVAVAAGDEVSAAVAALFGAFGDEFQALSAQAAEFHAWFVQVLVQSTGLYALAESANASPLRSLAREVLGVLNVPFGDNGTGGSGTSGGGSATGTGGTTTGGGLTASYTLASQWNNGFSAGYTITNSSAAPLTNWQAQFTLPANESITSAWNAQVAQSGTQYTLTPVSYDATIAPGGSVTFGFQASQTGTYSPPTNLLVNGQPITVGSAGTGSTSGTGSGTGTGGTTGGTVISTQYGTTTIANSYVVQNNAWNNPGGQSISVSPTGFSIATENGSAPTNGAPLGYPSIYDGWHYGTGSPGTNLPLQLTQIQTATSSISYTYPSSGIYDASYDIWLNPTPITTGVNQQEIMIWFNHVGPIQPVGSVVGNATIDGQSFVVWEGGNGQNNVVSYVATAPITSWNNMDVLSFIDNTETLEPVSNSWYLTSIQAGFEPWTGSVGASVDSFSTSVNGIS